MVLEYFFEIAAAVQAIYVLVRALKSDDLFRSQCYKRNFYTFVRDLTTSKKSVITSKYACRNSRRKKNSRHTSPVPMHARDILGSTQLEKEPWKNNEIVIILVFILEGAKHCLNSDASD